MTERLLLEAERGRSLIATILWGARVVLFGESLRVVGVRVRSARHYHQLNKRWKKPGRPPLGGGGGGGTIGRPFLVTDRLKELPEKL